MFVHDALAVCHRLGACPAFGLLQPPELCRRPAQPSARPSTSRPPGLLTPCRSFGAKYALLAMPPWLTGRITYDPPLPRQRNQCAQRTPMGAVVKVGPFSRRPGLKMPEGFLAMPNRLTAAGDGQPCWNAPDTAPFTLHLPAPLQVLAFYERPYWRKEGVPLEQQATVALEPAGAPCCRRQTMCMHLALPCLACRLPLLGAPG